MKKNEQIQDYTLKDIKCLGKGKLVTKGFQATNVGIAQQIIKKMKKDKAMIILTFTANMVASGLRGVFAELCKKKFVDIIITTPGALEHDAIKSIKPYLLGQFSRPGDNDKQLHSKGINRIGNIFVPNNRYTAFEDYFVQVLKEIYKKEKITCPCRIAEVMGKHIKSNKSFLYWCTKNKIPVFCPGITDGAIGLNAYYFKNQFPEFGIDVTKDMKLLGEKVLAASRTGGIILGGGISKHHAIGVNIIRGGLDYAVYVTTAQPWDGSLSGAQTTEAVSWGKIRDTAKHVTVNGDATIIFPLIIADCL